MGILKQHMIFLLLLILEFNTVVFARSPVNLQLSLANTDGSAQQVNQALKQYLSGISLSPDQSITITVTPPDGAKDAFLQTIMQAAKTIVPQFVSNAPISFKIGASKRMDGSLSNISLGIVLGKAISNGGSDVTNGGSSVNIPSSNIKNLNLDLSSSGSDPSGPISRQITTIINGFKPQLNQQQPIQIILNISPPQGSTQQYTASIMSTLRTLLQQLVPTTMESSVQATMQGNNDGTISSIKVTITITQSASGGNNPNGENIKLDLSRPFVNILQAVKTVLSTVVQNPTVSGNGNNPIKINLQIVPPIGATKTIIQSIVGTIKSVLVMLIPSAKLSIKTAMSQGATGFISNVNCEINIEPTSSNNPNQISFNLDLSNSASDLVQEVTNILPNIQTQVNPILTNGEPVTLNLNIRPPRGVTDRFVKSSTDTIVSLLQKVLPNKMKVTASANKNPQGSIEEVILIIVIQPDNEIIEIDLTKPGNSLIQQITNILPDIKNKVNKEQPKGKPVTYTFNINPPKGSPDQFVKNTMNTLLTSLSQILPNNKIGVQAKTTKDSRGNITNVSLILTIQPNPNAEQPPNEETLNVDLSKPGTDLIEEVTNILPVLKSKVDKEQPKGEPINFNLNIQPPKGSSQEFVKQSMNTILTTLSQIFPNNKIKAKAESTKDSQGNISEINYVFTIEPNPNEQEPNNPDVIDVDLTKPGTDLVQEVTKILPNLKNKVNEEEPKGKPVSFDLNIQPPKGSTDQFVKNSMNTVLTTLSQIFPNNKVGVQAKTTKDSQGNIKNVSMVYTIHPNNKAEEPNSGESSSEVVEVDLTKPGSSLIQEITNILPDLKNKVNKEQPIGKPVSFDLNIKPPKGTTDEFVKDTMKTVLTTLSQIFPNNKVGVKAKTTKDPQGNITEVSMVYTIHPNPEEPTIGKPEGVELVDVDLTEPGSSVVTEVTKVLPNLKNKVEKEQTKGKPVSFDLNIKPPKGSTNQFVKDTMQKVLTTLSQIFPNNKVGVKAKTTKDTQGNITNISMIYTIYPNPGTEKPNVGEPNSEEPSGEEPSSEELNEIPEVNMDLTKPGSNLVQEVTKVLPDLKDKVNKEQPKGKPVSFDMNIKPPKGSTNQFVKDTMQTVLTTLSQIFPNNKVTVKAKTTKDPQGNITNVSMVYIINPQPGTEKPNSEEPSGEEPNSEELNNRKPIEPEEEPSVEEPNIEEPINKQPETTEVVDVDLTKPGSNLIQEVTKTLPGLKNKVNKELPKGKPVSFDLNIKPPKGSTNQFVKDTMQTVLTTLSQIFPNNKVSVKAKTTKDPQGNITNVSMVYIINPQLETEKPNSEEPSGEEPNSEELNNREPMEPEEEPSVEEPNNKEPNNKQPETTEVVDLDLTKPGSNLIQEITKTLPDLKNKVNKEQPKGKPVSFDLNVKPPKGSTNQFVKDTMQTVLTTLSQIFPNNKVSVKAKTTKDPQGNITNVSMVYIINPQPGTEKPNSEEPSGEEPNSEELNNREPMEPEEPSVEEPNIKEPNNKQPETTEVVDVDLTKPGSDLVQEVTKVLPDLKDKVNKEQPKGKPVSFDMNIKPPKGSTTQFVKDTMQTVLTTLSQIFPNNKVSVKAKTTKDPQGNITNVSMVYIINPQPETEKPNSEEPSGEEPSGEEPNSEEFNNREPIEPKEEPSVEEPNIEELNNKQPETTEVVDVDLTKPGSNLIQEVTKTLPGLKNKVNKEQPKGKPVSFDLNIKPPKGSTNQFVKDTMQTVLTTLSQIFPNNKVSVKAKTTKDPQGNITNVSMVYIINPQPEIEKPNSEEPSGEEPNSEELNNREPNEPVEEPSVEEPNVEEPNPFIETVVTPGEPSENSEEPENITCGEEELEMTPSTETSEEETTQSNNEITEEESSVEVKPREVNLDLSKPGSNIKTIVTQVLPNIVPKIQQELSKDKPTTLSFNIQPPAGSKTDFVKTTTQSLVPILSKYFPDNKISVTSKGKKDPEGNLTELILLITVKPNQSEKPRRKDVLVDLSKPGTNLEDQVNKDIPDVVSNVRNDLDKGKPIILNFKIRPPPGAKEDYLQTTAESLITILSKHFPSNKINIHTNAKKDPQGNLSDMTLEITVEPSKQQQPKEKNVDIDLSKPGVTLDDQVEKILPNVVPDVEDNLNEGRPVTMNFNIKPPQGSTQDYLQITTQLLVPILTKYFPNNKISVKTSAQKNPQGYLSNMVLEITFEPSENQQPKKENVDIDLSRPGVTLDDQVDKALPNVIPNVENNLNQGRPVTLNFNIKPPKGSKPQYLQVTTQSLVPILTKYFPNNKIDVKTSAQKNPQGYLTDMILEITIQPPSHRRPKENNVDVDLSRPGVTLVGQVSKVLPSVITSITNDMSSGKPVTLNFNIRPPNRSRQPYLKTVTSQLMPILLKYFPNNKISVKTSSRQNPNGYLSDIIVTIIIQPSSVVVQPKENTVDLDLSRPGVTLVGQVNRVLPKVVTNVQNDLNRGKQITLNFNIRPPRRSSQSYLKTITNQLVPVLSKYFPSNQISVKTSAKQNSQGFLLDILLIVTIQPAGGRLTNIDIDLSRRGASLTNQVNLMLPKFVTNVRNELKQGQIVTLNFNIRPPKGSRDSYLKIASNQLVPILRKYFPNYTLSVKTSAQRTLLGFLSDIVLTITIQSSSGGNILKPNNGGVSINLDLSRPGLGLVAQVTRAIPRVMINLTRNLSNGRRATLNFIIKPPSRATQAFVKSTTNSLIPVLAGMFPRNQINVKSNANQDSRGYITEIVLIITIEPAK